MVTPRSLSIITRLINNDYVLRRKQVSVALEVATKELGYKLRQNQEAARLLETFWEVKMCLWVFLRVLENPSATLLFTSKSVRWAVTDSLSP